MLDPYFVLDLPHDADEAAVRQKYLELVRRYPPEREPAKAAEIRAAYDLLRDPVKRLEHQLFDVVVHETFEELLDKYQPDLRGQRFATDVLLSLGEP